MVPFREGTLQDQDVRVADAGEEDHGQERRGAVGVGGLLLKDDVSGGDEHADKFPAPSSSSSSLELSV